MPGTARDRTLDEYDPESVAYHDMRRRQDPNYQLPKGFHVDPRSGQVMRDPTWWRRNQDKISWSLLAAPAAGGLGYGAATGTGVFGGGAAGAAGGAGAAGPEMIAPGITSTMAPSSFAAGEGAAAGGGFWGGVGGALKKIGWGPVFQGIGLGVGALLGRQAQKNAMKRSDEENYGLKGEQQMAAQLGRQGTGMMDESRPYMTQPANYYQTLLSGNRAAMSQAVAAPTAQLTQQARGAERGLERSGVRGAARDVASADINRQRQSAIAGLTTGVQPYAAGQLATLGGNMFQAGAGAAGTAGNIYSDLLQSGFRNRVYARGEGEKTATAVGKLAATLNKAPGTPPTPDPVTAPAQSQQLYGGVPNISGTGQTTRSRDPWANVVF